MVPASQPDENRSGRLPHVSPVSETEHRLRQSESDSSAMFQIPWRPPRRKAIVSPHDRGAAGQITKSLRDSQIHSSTIPNGSSFEEQVLHDVHVATSVQHGVVLRTPLGLRTRTPGSILPKEYASNTRTIPMPDQRSARSVQAAHPRMQIQAVPTEEAEKYPAVRTGIHRQCPSNEKPPQLPPRSLPREAQARPDAHRPTEPKNREAPRK